MVSNFFQQTRMKIKLLCPECAKHYETNGFVTFLLLVPVGSRWFPWVPVGSRGFPAWVSKTQWVPCMGFQNTVGSLYGIIIIFSGPSQSEVV